MTPELQRRVQRYGWDRASGHYESYWQKQLKPAQDKLLEMAKLQPGEKIIDIACGTGLVSFPAVEKVGTSGFVMCTDLSDKMVQMCSDLAKEKNLFNMAFERMDAEALNVPDNEYDVSLCALGLMYVPDPLSAVREMFRVIKPGGRAVAAVWGKRDHCGWAEVFDIVDKRVVSEVCPMFFNLGNQDVLERNFKAAGFSKVVTERLSTHLIYHSDEEAYGAAFAGGPVAMAYSRFEEQVKNEVHSEYLDSIRPYHLGKGYAVPGEFVVTMGVKEGLIG